MSTSESKDGTTKRESQRSINSRLKKFGEISWKADYDIRELLIPMTTKGLKRVISDVETLTESNCWYAIYDAAPKVKHEAQYILQLREKS